ncbi:unnamed protein product [Leptidea sinapis]|uniref:Uncharacterized protein n=1 Tax=Leptidea sinapis TaxID=189913 RepID=A0A5E4Q0U4_9NEOP|nr:unnamed protein product [Leptidea sinapis]
MVRMAGIKWERAVECRPNHNIISSDFPKYCPQPWKFMQGPARIQWLLSYEYQRMWIVEREAWKKRLFPEKTAQAEDIVKNYVLSFKTNTLPPKPEPKKPFKMKKYEGVSSRTTTKRKPNDKAMKFLKEKKERKPKQPQEN